MSETLTYDPGTDTVTEGEALTPAEQESLEVGEALIEGQDKLLAGKYEDAQALEKAYIELQKKLGEDGNEVQDNKAEDKQEEVLQETSEEEPQELSETAELITSASDEYFEKGDLTPETLEKFASMDSKDLVRAYMEIQSNAAEAEKADISDAQVNEIKSFAGGEQAYSDITSWAADNLDKGSIEAFDSIVNSGSPEAIKLAVSGLKSQYQQANGYEGNMVTGKAPTNTKDVYRSQAEVVEAMKDRRYDNDPAYRMDVMEKLSRSNNVQF